MSESTFDYLLSELTDSIQRSDTIMFLVAVSFDSHRSNVKRYASSGKCKKPVSILLEGNALVLETVTICHIPFALSNNLCQNLQTSTGLADLEASPHDHSYVAPSSSVKDNIEQIFTKFIDSGKATIRIINPPHDLIIRCDAIQLKSFVRVLKLGLSRNIDAALLPASGLKNKDVSSMPRTKIVIKRNSDYPVLEGFPRMTRELQLSELGRKSFDRQILKLQSLRILNLSNNLISTLPKELGSLPNLRELVLSQNDLGRTSLCKWTWLDGEKVMQNLQLLDISSNFLNKLPNQIGKLRALVTLKVNRNSLTTLPQSIGNMFSLQYLDVSENGLIHLPGTIKNLRLNCLDISSNNFIPTNEFQQYHLFLTYNRGVCSLVEASARVILKNRRPYDASAIPLTLVKYLDDAHYCMCGSTCFNSYLRDVLPMNTNSISNSIKSSGSCIVPVNCYFCSVKCAQSYSYIYL